MSVGEAWAFTIAAFAISWLLAWTIAPGGRRHTFWMFVAASLITALYSVPPFRTKRLGVWANVTVAIPRGALLKVAGWSTVKTAFGWEPCSSGRSSACSPGATTTKDFADMKGDARRGAALPLQCAPPAGGLDDLSSFVVLFLMINAGAWAGVLTGIWLLQPPAPDGGLGLYVCFLMLRRPEDLAVEENHVSWAHMYRMMFVAQVGFALAYLL